MPKVPDNWYTFVTSITEYTSQKHMYMLRNQADELRALQDTLYFIGGKWRLPIINSICNGHRRFREIERSIPGITTRMLSKELKEMEMNKLVKRTVYDASPVLVEYEPTEHCRSFGRIIMEMIDWGVSHRKVVTRKQ
jgi:DNA-binding HxlR family transcriptional regulator